MLCRRCCTSLNKAGAVQQGEPGRRFEDRWRRKRPGGLARKILVIGTGSLLFAAGLFFLPAPGPGTLIVIAGAALLAEESRWVARALDRAELGLRAASRAWKRAPPALKGSLVFAALIVALGLAAAAYRMLFL